MENLNLKKKMELTTKLLTFPYNIQTDKVTFDERKIVKNNLDGKKK